MTIGTKLKERRHTLNLTQQDVATQLHLTRQTISNWENDKSTPDLQSVIDLSDIYGISLDNLLKGDKQMVKRISQREQQKGFKHAFLVLLVPILLAFYLLPLAMTQAGSEISILGVWTPAILLLTTGCYGYFLGFDWWYPLLIGGLFIPTILIYLNSSALIFIPAYTILAFLGLGVGSLGAWLKTKTKQKKNRLS